MNEYVSSDLRCTIKHTTGRKIKIHVRTIYMTFKKIVTEKNSTIELLIKNNTFIKYDPQFIVKGFKTNITF